MWDRNRGLIVYVTGKIVAYFIPVGLFIEAWAPTHFWEATGFDAADYPTMTWTDFLLGNLVRSVTIGNVVGGALLVGLVYWFVYRRDADRAAF